MDNYSPLFELAAAFNFAAILTDVVTVKINKIVSTDNDRIESMHQSNIKLADNAISSLNKLKLKMLPEGDLPEIDDQTPGAISNFVKKYKRLITSLNEAKQQSNIHISRLKERGVRTIDSRFSVDCFIAGLYSIIILLISGVYSESFSVDGCFHYNSIITLTLCFWGFKVFVKYALTQIYTHMKMLTALAICMSLFCFGKCQDQSNLLDYSSLSMFGTFISFPLEGLAVAVSLLFSIHHFLRELFWKAENYRSFYSKQADLANAITVSVAQDEQEIVATKKVNLSDSIP